MVYLNQRQNQILDYLQEQKRLTISQIQQRFTIPTATVYRDVSHLVEAGLAYRVRGGLTLEKPQDRSASPQSCGHCGGAVKRRTAFTIQLPANQPLNACCPHCGFLLIDQHPDATSALTVDFLYGKQINVRQAIYLVASEVQLCCAPSVFAFASIEDAQRFQAGFGGDVLDYEHALEKTCRLMDLHGHHHHPD